MTARIFVGVVLVLVLALPLQAHDGHVHKVMGTVAGRQAAQLEVRTREGKTVTIALNEKTKILRGSERAGVEDLEPGVRVVVDVGNGKTPLTAREIKLGTSAARK